MHIKFMQCLLHIMLIWQHIERDFTWILMAMKTHLVVVVVVQLSALFQH